MSIPIVLTLRFDDVATVTLSFSACASGWMRQFHSGSDKRVASKDQPIVIDAISEIEALTYNEFKIHNKREKLRTLKFGWPSGDMSARNKYSPILDK